MLDRQYHAIHGYRTNPKNSSVIPHFAMLLQGQILATCEMSFEELSSFAYGHFGEHLKR